ncbi:MAG: hypothetical protein NXY57DRAFT_1044308 [Lentinula lateritia]|nr:MAG: hypothetical protein NXY57DRAFT_1044308 [Lentinula lateritia]
MATPCVLAKKRKSSVWQEEGGFSWRKHPVGEVSELDVVPEAHDRKHKCPVGGSRDAEVPDYRRVVLVLCPLLVDTPDSATLSGGPVNEIVHFPPPSEESGSNRVPLPQSQGRSSDLLTHKQSNPPGLSNQFIPPVHSREALHPYPQAQATAALKADKKALWAEVADLHKLLEASCTKTLTLTSLLWDTLTSLNNCNKDLEDVGADFLEYNCVLAQFMAIEAELPEAPLEDALTQFHVAVSEVQRQKLLELHEQVDKEQKRSYEPTRNWTLLMHDKLTASEAMLHRMATFAHWLHSADPANLLHHHNMYMGGLIEPVITLLPRYVDACPGSLEPPLHCRLFSFGHPIPLPQSPTSNHIPVIPMMDSVMLMWEGIVEAYICEVLGYPASPDRVPFPVEAPSSNAPLLAITSLVTDDARSVLGASIPMPRRTPLFLPGSLLPTSPHSPSPIPSSPHVLDVSHEVVDQTMDETKDLYELQEEFLAWMCGAVTVKQEIPESDVV